MAQIDKGNGPTSQIPSTHVPYPTMYYYKPKDPTRYPSKQRAAHFCSEWRIVMYGAEAS